jgi:iron(III) transport system permease protein
MFAEFGALSLLRVQTFTTAIFQSYQLQFDSASAALQAGVLLVLCLPPAIGEMRLRAGIKFARVGRKSARSTILTPLGGTRLPVLAVFSLLTFVAVGVPLLTLGYWLAVGRSAGAGHQEIWEAVLGSFELSAPGAAIVVALALPLVLCGVRYRGWFAQFADRVPYIVHGIPGLVIAFALVFVSVHYAPALYQTVALLFAAYAMLFMPLAQSALRASLELISPRWEEAARSLGRGPAAAFLAVTIPNILPGIGAALGLMTLELVRELTATLMLAPSGVVTLATQTWSHTNDGQYAAAAPFAALLVLVSAAPVFLLTRRAADFHDPA